MMKIAICAMIKNENLYLRDWVEYYKKLGATNIIIYDNNSKDGESPYQVIGDYIYDGYVLYHDIRGVVQTKEDIWKYEGIYSREQIEMWQNTQTQTFNQHIYNQECFDLYKREYDWIVFLDIDEYVELVLDETLEEYLGRFDKIVDEIFLNWKNYGDSGKVSYEQKPVYERFTNPTEPVDFRNKEAQLVNTICKAFINCSKPENWNAHFMKSHHYITFDRSDAVYASSNGGFLPKPTISILWNYDVAYIKHFYTKTIFEYIERRLGNKVSSYRDEDIIFFFANFFYYSKLTEKKKDIVNKYLKKIGKEYLEDIIYAPRVIVHYKKEKDNNGE